MDAAELLTCDGPLWHLPLAHVLEAQHSDHKGSEAKGGCIPDLPCWGSQGADAGLQGEGSLSVNRHAPMQPHAPYNYFKAPCVILCGVTLLPPCQWKALEPFSLSPCNPTTQALTCTPWE